MGWWLASRSRLAAALVGLVDLSGLLGLVACSSLPTIVPDLARESGVRRSSWKGRTARCRRRRARRSSTAWRAAARHTDIFERHLALEEAIVGSPLTTGNQVLLLQDGPATYQAMLAAILAARDHINMETYILDDDEVGQRFAQALIDKQRQGVQVNLIRDSVGTIGTPAAFFQRLTDSGIQVLEFNPRQPAGGAQGLGAEPARPPQAADRRRAHGVPGRHQHQQRVLRRLVQPGLARPARRQPAVARYRPAAAGPGGRRTAEAVPRDLGGTEGRAAAGEELLPAAREAPAAQVVRAIGSSPDEAVQPDLRHAALGHRQRRDQRAASPMPTSPPTRNCSTRSKPRRGAAST